MTRKPSRPGRWLKWAGLVGCLLMGVLWYESLWLSVACKGDDWGAGFVEGAVWVAHREGTGFWRARAWEVLRAREGGLPPLERWWPRPVQFGASHYVFVPIWVPFLILAGLTVWVWHFRAPYPSGCCQQCGYDLTGNVSGMCPECGDSA